jgi:asparagine synthase (glutamine-hydrolysing)
MMASLTRRGPDALGFWTNGRTTMAHTRLAILGLDERGTEPLENETHVLAFNGEIYNFLDVARRLHIPAPNDAAVLLEAWSLRGPQILDELEGFWAFVVFDKRSGTLVMCRDQFGVKPLYYAATPEGITIASTIGALREALPVRPTTLNYDALSEYVRYQFTFGDKTFLRTVHKVPPGHMVTWDDGDVTDVPYEDIWAVEGKERATPEWIAKTRSLLIACVGESTISDASYTALCSGGLDSSLVTRITAPELAYHGNYTDPDCNETAYAKEVVEGTHTRLMVVNAREEFDLVDRLRSLVEDFDELTVGSVILPLDDVLDQVKRRHKVALTGTGGDELFAGYVRYALARGECPDENYRPMFDRMRGCLTPTERFEVAHAKGIPDWYKPFYENPFERFYDACTGGHLRFDRTHFLPALLNIDDKIAGRHGLETRPSLLHQRLVRHVVQLAPEEPMGGPLKKVLREIARPLLPPAVVDRTDKMGFTTPIGTFVNRSAHRIREQIESSKFRDLYDLRKVKIHAETKWSREVFGLLMLDLWLNRYAT